MRTGRTPTLTTVHGSLDAAGVAALEDDAHVAHARRVVSQAKEYPVHELDALGVPVMPSAANFILAKVGDAPGLRHALLRRSVAVRDCTSFGLPEHIRIAVRRPEECARLVEALRDVLGRD